MSDKLAEAWAIGYQDACDEMGSTCLLDGPDDWRNPYADRANATRKPRYFFSHRSRDNRYYWVEARQIGQAHTTVHICDVDWFWDGSGTRPPAPKRHRNDCYCHDCYTAAMGGGR